MLDTLSGGVYMEKKEIYTTIQEYVRDVPMLLFGTGATIPYGIPGMGALTHCLVENLQIKYRGNSEWEKFQSNILSGLDLESALANISMPHDVLDDIIVQTWNLVNTADLSLLYDLIKNNTILPIGRLIKRFFDPNPQCVNIVTTNYDRVIEYACDQIHVSVDKRFKGYYIKIFSNSHLSKNKIVNLIKVHGSLDLFRNRKGYVTSIPLQKSIPDGLVPEIVTPGENKYRSILTGECRDLVHISDELINNANSYLCIGYGFNDEQIQRNIITGIRDSKPIVIATKKISKSAASLISSNSCKYVIIQESNTDPNCTDFVVNGVSEQLLGTYWSINGFLNII